MSESIDEGNNASGTGKDGAPILEGEVGGDDGAGAFVATADDAVEEISGARVAREISEFVEDQDVRPLCANVA